MTLTAAGFPGSVNDVQWSTLVDLLGYDGTIGMSVSASTGDRTVSIASGASNVGGILATNDAAITVGPLPANAGSLTRIDRIILRANWSNKTLSATYRQGTPSANPQPPTLTRNPGVQYEVRLAQVVVAPGTGNLSSGDILAERVPPVSGFYNTPSFRNFPDADIGALVWYGASNSLRVPIDGEYVEIANAREEMRPRHVAQAANILIAGSTYAAGSPVCGTTFVAPPSGSVIVSMFGVVEQPINNGSSHLSFEVRSGVTIGAGSLIFGASDEYSIVAGEAVNDNAPARASGTVRRMITGLTANAVYNARTMQRRTVNGGEVQNRYLLIEPVA